jgi:hypothetical protein
LSALSNFIDRQLVEHSMPYRLSPTVEFAVIFSWDFQSPAASRISAYRLSGTQPFGSFLTGLNAIFPTIVHETVSTVDISNVPKLSKFELCSPYAKALQTRGMYVGLPFSSLANVSCTHI